MALPQVGSGYQLSDGNLNEVDIQLFLPQAATTTATLTTAQLTGGILVASPGAVAASYTLPSVAVLETTLVNAKVGTSFEVRLVNLGTASGVVTFLVGTGWTITGAAAVAVTSSAQFTASKTATNAWTLYRTA